MKKKSITIEQMVEAVHHAGGTISLGLTPEPMPHTFEGDSPAVLALVEEARKCNAIAADWKRSKYPNGLVINSLEQLAWAYSGSAALLRARLPGAKAASLGRTPMDELVHTCKLILDAAGRKGAVAGNHPLFKILAGSIRRCETEK